MGRLTNIKVSSSGSPAEIAKSVRAPQSFQKLCDGLTVKAYNQLLKEKKYKSTWQEDTFTGNFYLIIEKLCIENDLPVQVIYQEPQLTPTILDGTDNPNAAKRIDLVFSQFARPQKIKYGIEAKILTSINIGTRNAKRLCTEYVISGMDRFIEGSYNMAGCMVGYLVAGNAKDALKLINECLCKRSRRSEILKEKHTIDMYTECYRSNHKKCTIKHFIFLFL